MKIHFAPLFGLALASSLMISPLVAPASALAATDKINVELNGSHLQMDQEPFVYDSSTFVPLRAIFEALGASIHWDATTRTVTATQDDVTIKLTIGSKTAYRNDAPVQLDAAPMVRDDRSYVPVRFIAESFNTPVKWDGNTKTVRLLPSNRGELERIMSTQVEFPEGFHVEGNLSVSQTDGVRTEQGNIFSSVDFDYDFGNDNVDYLYHGVFRHEGAIYSPDYEMYASNDRAYVKYNGFQTWQTSSFEKAPNLPVILDRTKVPYVYVPTNFAKYGVLEQTETEDILTFYFSQKSYDQLAAQEEYPTINGLLNFMLKYTLDKQTHYTKKLDQSFQLKSQGSTITWKQSDTYTKVGQADLVTIPAATQKATEADLSHLQ